MNCIQKCLHDVRLHVSTNCDTEVQSRDTWVKLRIDEMLSEFYSLDARARYNMLGKGLGDTSAYLLGIARGLSEQALTYNDPSFLITALIALVAERGTRDQRESCQKFAMIEHSAKLLDVDMHYMFDTLKKLDNLHCEDIVFIDSVLQIQVGQSIDLMGYQLVQEANRAFKYKQIR